jgi:hypothetical protein
MLVRARATRARTCRCQLCQLPAGGAASSWRLERAMRIVLIADRAPRHRAAALHTRPAPQCRDDGRAHLGARRNLDPRRDSAGGVKLVGFLFLALLSFATPATAQVPPYAVIFEVNVRPDGHVENLVVGKVIDPRSGSTNPVDIAVPQEFVAAVRAKLNAKTPPPAKTHYFTYFMFDPRDPANADIGTSK